MFYLGAVCGLVVGAFCGWGITYAWLKRHKVAAKVEAAAPKEVAKVVERVVPPAK